MSKTEKLTVIASSELASALRDEQERLDRQEGLRVSLSAVACAAIQRGLNPAERAAT